MTRRCKALKYQN